MTTYDVTEHGAVGNRMSDDRVAIQAVIDRAMADGGGKVYLPDRDFLVGEAPVGYRCLTVGGLGVQLFGPGRLVQAPCRASVRLLHLSGEELVLDGITLDGNQSRQGSPDEHRAGIFADGTTGLQLRKVNAIGFTGDGFYLYRAEDTWLDHVSCADNGRNGITLGGTVLKVLVQGSRFERNRAQQFDCEPGQGLVTDVEIRGCMIDGSISNDYALTISGSSEQPSQRWVVENNKIRGGVFVTSAHDVTFGRNRVVNNTTKPCVEIERASDRVRVVGNDLRALQTRKAQVGVVYVEGTEGSGPSRVLVSGNRIRSEHSESFGVSARGAVSVSVVGNDIEGKATTAISAGVYLRATTSTRAFESALVTDNQISGYPRGVSVAGNGDAELSSLTVQRNVIAGAREALALDSDNTHAAKTIVKSANEVRPLRWS